MKFAQGQKDRADRAIEKGLSETSMYSDYAMIYVNALLKVRLNLEGRIAASRAYSKSQ